MSKVLIVTNDFPPRSGGIQSFVHALATRLPSDDAGHRDGADDSGGNGVVVYAPAWSGAADFDARQPYPVIRHPGSLMLPVPSVAARASALLTEHGCDSVLFGAAAPLGLLAPRLRRAGAKRIVGLTHGHEAGWAALPGASSLLRRIGNEVDALTYLAEYTRIRMARALSSQAAGRLVKLTPGVDPAEFRPGAGGPRIRQQLAIAPDRPVVVCVSRMVPRKGQDLLIRVWPAVRKQSGCDPLLLLVGDGPYRSALDRLADQSGVAGSVLFSGPVSGDDLPAYYDAGNIFAMPCRTRRAGLDVEGLGIVYLEASATGLPVIGGDSGGAPDAILDGETGYVVPGRDGTALTDRLVRLLADPAGAAAMGDKGQAWIDREWTWDLVAARLARILAGELLTGPPSR